MEHSGHRLVPLACPQAQPTSGLPPHYSMHRQKTGPFCIYAKAVFVWFSRCICINFKMTSQIPKPCLLISPCSPSFAFSTSHSMQTTLLSTRHHQIPYNALQYHTMSYNTMQYQAIAYNAMQYQAVACNSMHSTFPSTTILQPSELTRDSQQQPFHPQRLHCSTKNQRQPCLLANI